MATPTIYNLTIATDGTKSAITSISSMDSDAVTVGTQLAQPTNIVLDSADGVPSSEKAEQLKKMVIRKEVPASLPLPPPPTTPSEQVVPPVAPLSGQEQVVAPVAPLSGQEQIVPPSGQEQVVPPVAPLSGQDQIVPEPSQGLSGSQPLVTPTNLGMNSTLGIQTFGGRRTRKPRKTGKRRPRRGLSKKQHKKR